MTSQNLKTKIIQHSQKRQLIHLMANLSEDVVRISGMEPLYFPESCIFITDVLEISKKISEKRHFATKEQACKQMEILLSYLSDESALLCSFPNFSIFDNMPVSNLPVLKVNGQCVRLIFNEVLNLNDIIHVFICATHDLKKGIFFDVCAGDPEITGSDAPIYDIHLWGFNNGPNN